MNPRNFGLGAAQLILLMSVAQLLPTRLLASESVCNPPDLNQAEILRLADQNSNVTNRICSDPKYRRRFLDPSHSLVEVMDGTARGELRSGVSIGQTVRVVSMPSDEVQEAYALGQLLAERFGEMSPSERDQLVEQKMESLRHERKKSKKKRETRDAIQKFRDYGPTFIALSMIAPFVDDGNISGAVKESLRPLGSATSKLLSHHAPPWLRTAIGLAGYYFFGFRGESNGFNFKVKPNDRQIYLGYRFAYSGGELQARSSAHEPDVITEEEKQTLPAKEIKRLRKYRREYAAALPLVLDDLKESLKSDPVLTCLKADLKEATERQLRSALQADRWFTTEVRNFRDLDTSVAQIRPEKNSPEIFNRLRAEFQQHRREVISSPSSTVREPEFMNTRRFYLAVPAP